MKITKAEVDLMNNICMLLEQHGAWTRMAIMSMVLGNNSTYVFIDI